MTFLLRQIGFQISVEHKISLRMKSDINDRKTEVWLEGGDCRFRTLSSFSSPNIIPTEALPGSGVAWCLASKHEPLETVP